MTCQRSLTSFSRKLAMPTRPLAIVFVLLAAGFVVVAGCTKQRPGSATIAPGAIAQSSTPVHQHGPHGGHIIDFGTIDNSAELVFAPAAPIVGVYILGADASKDAPIDAKTISLYSSVDGKTNKFE